MLRLLLRPLVFSGIVFVAFTLFARVFSQNNDSLTQIKADLTSPNCPTPCFMGIQPGTTQAEDALRRLRRDEWVLLVENTPIRSDGDRSVIIWSWSGMQPVWISGFSTGAIRVRDGVVSQIELETMLTFSDVWQMFDRPDQGVVRPRGAVTSDPQVIHFAYYENLQLWVRMETLCPMTPGQFWGAKVRLILGGSPSVQLEPYDLPRWFLHQPECAR